MKINFIYSKGRKERLNSKEEIPSEFFYGFMELKKYFKELKIFEERELGMQMHTNLLGKLFRKLSFLSNGDKYFLMMSLDNKGLLLVFSQFW